MSSSPSPRHPGAGRGLVLIAQRFAALDSSLRWNDEDRTPVTPGLIRGQAYCGAALKLALPRLVGRGDGGILMLRVEANVGA